MEEVLLVLLVYRSAAKLNGRKVQIMSQLGFIGSLLSPVKYTILHPTGQAGAGGKAMKGLGWPSYGAGNPPELSCVGSLCYSLPPNSDVGVFSCRSGFGRLQSPSPGRKPETRW